MTPNGDIELSSGARDADYGAEGRRMRTRATKVPSMPAVSEFVLGQLGGDR